MTMKSKNVAFPVGLRIVDIRWMTKEEMEKDGWGNYGDSCPVLVLDDGSLIYASCDPEGNGPGMLYGYSQGEPCYVYPLKKEELK